MRKNQQTEQSRHKKAGMSKKHHEADARRALLEIFLLRMRNETGEGYDERFRQVFSSDVLKVVEDGLRAALEGSTNPFALRVKGLKAKLTRQQEIDAVARVQCRPETEAIDAAFDRVAEEFSTSCSVIRDAYGNAETRAWADLQAEAYKDR